MSAKYARKNAVQPPTYRCFAVWPSQRPAYTALGATTHAHETRLERATCRFELVFPASHSKEYSHGACFEAVTHARHVVAILHASAHARPVGRAMTSDVPCTHHTFHEVVGGGQIQRRTARPASALGSLPCGFLRRADALLYRTVTHVLTSGIGQDEILELRRPCSWSSSSRRAKTRASAQVLPLVATLLACPSVLFVS